MASQAQFDLLVQFRPTLVADTFTRVLNDPVTTDPRSPGALPRRIRVAVPGILLWWDAPSLTLNDDGTMSVSVALAGGIRQASAPGDAGRIASVTGTLQARMKPLAAQASGPSQITLELDAIDQRNLRASYAGSNAKPLITGVGGGPADIVQAVVRDAVSVLVAQPALIQFLRDLGKRPITLEHAAFPLQAAPSSERPTLYWPKGGEPLAIGIAQTGATGDLARAELRLPDRADSNVAVTVSSAYLTAKLRSLLVSGVLARSLRDDAGNELAQLEDLEAHVGAGELIVSVRAAYGHLRGLLNAVVALTPDASTGLTAATIRRVSLDMDTAPAGAPDPDMERAMAALSMVPNRLKRGYWLELLAALLGATVNNGELDVTQRYIVPGTQVAVSGRPTALEMADDALTIYAALPTDAVFVPQPPHRQPRVAIAQDPLHLPTQGAPGQPVDATVGAVLTSPSYEPYDYAWDAGNMQHVAGEHNEFFTVRGVPSGTGAVVEELARASVTVIDSFGQTADAMGPILARPARRSRPSHPRPRPRSLVRVLVPALLIVAVILGGGIVFAGNFFHPPVPGTPPLLAVTPQTDYQQTCTPAVLSLPPIFVTLDNSRNTAAITWTATTHGTVSGGSEPWASLNDSGASATGTISGRQTSLLTIQPASDLCAAVQRASTQQQFTVSLSYSLAGSGSLRPGEAAVAADALALAAASRQITLSDTIGISAFSAYMLNSDRQPVITLAEACDQQLAIVPRELLVTLDNTRSTTAASWQLSIPDQVPVTGNPIEPWASADTLAGTVAAGQQSRLVVVLAADLCRQLLNETAPVPLRLVVLANDRNPITLTDTVTPPPHIVNLSIQPLAFQQSCSDGLKPLTVTLDNSQSNVPVTWQVDSVDSVAPPGTPTPASGETWASVSPTTGTLQPGPNNTVTVTITPASDICTVYLSVGSSNTYHVIFTYASNQSITVTDTISNPIP